MIGALGKMHEWNCIAVAPYAMVFKDELRAIRMMRHLLGGPAGMECFRVAQKSLARNSSRGSM